MWGWVQTAAGRTATDALLPGPALVLSPHQDDETIGCGLLIAKKRNQEIPVAVAVATDGSQGWFSPTPQPTAHAISEIRHREWHQALDVLAVPRADRFEFGFTDGDLSAHEHDLRDQIGDVLGRVRPSQVFVTRPGDPHPDHRTLARAATLAVAQMAPRPQVFAYRVYPGEGLRRAEDASRVKAGTALVQFAGTLLGRGDRALLFRASELVPTKAAAIGAYVSQRRLLEGELRHVWGSGAELYWPVAGPGPGGGRDASGCPA
jgi:LmbE family N-acetylglucosaminyl deacetylase